jgi:hypothetical protein
VRRVARLLLGLGALALAPRGGAAEVTDVFDVQTLRVKGRATEVAPAPRAAGAADLVVSVERGTAPETTRSLAIFRVGSERRYGDGVAREIALAPEIAAWDLAPGPTAGAWRIVLVAADGLRLVDSASGEARTLELGAPQPLPPPTWMLRRVRFVLPPGGTGGPAAIAPALDGGVLVGLDDARRDPLALPLLAEHDTEETAGPDFGLVTSHVSWPNFELGDDDGDGAPDLFALHRFGASVFRSRDGALTREPARRSRLRPFPPAEELRHEVTSVRLFARDVDADGLTDLVVQRNTGTLLGSRSRTDVFANGGAGADLAGPASASLELAEGLAAIAVEDLDGDGRRELLQTRLAFGIVQVIRVLVTREVEAELRIFSARGAGLSELVESWRGDLRLPLDFDEGRVAGLVPTVEGDWNGDGRKDLLHGAGAGQLAIRLGEAGELGPRFGGSAARQAIPAGDLARVGDLDGDALDDLVLFDPRDPAGELHVLWNRGVLPGTRPRLEAP